MHNSHDKYLKNIDDVKDFISKYKENVKEISDILENSIQEESALYFRGQANSNWPLISSVARQNESEPIIKNLEEPFKELANYQHHGTHTRLLDYTTDVRVALFFACDDKNNKCENGAVFITEYVPYFCNFSSVKDLCLLSQLKEPITIKQFIFDTYGYNLSSKELEDKECEIYSYVNYGFIVQPNDEFYSKIVNNNKNMITQKGCFYISGNKVRNTQSKAVGCVLYNNKGDVVIEPKIEGVSPVLTSEVFTKKYIIPY